MPEPASSALLPFRQRAPFAGLFVAASLGVPFSGDASDESELMEAIERQGRATDKAARCLRRRSRRVRRLPG
jgi:hypothetical protein